MPFNVQQVNATTRLVNALETLKRAYYDAVEIKDAAALIGVPAAGDFPAPGDLDHITRERLLNAHGVVDALKTFMATAVDLNGPAGGPNKSPLDAIVEVIR